MAFADQETTFSSIFEQSNTTLSTASTKTKEASTFMPITTKYPAKLSSLNSTGTEGKPKEKLHWESDECDEQLFIFEDRINDLDIKLNVYSKQKKALTSVMKIVLELLMNEVSLDMDDDLDKKS